MEGELVLKLMERVQKLLLDIPLSRWKTDDQGKRKDSRNSKLRVIRIYSLIFKLLGKSQII